MKNTVSLVIPVYNSERFLRQCLDSVCSQTYKDIEVICVDDGSTDHSFELLNEYAEQDGRIHVFSNTLDHKGAAGARNLGLQKATGKYVQFVDSDDFFEPDMTESLVAKADKTGAEVVICRGQRFDDGLQKVTGNLPHPDLQYAPDKDSFFWKDCPEYICEIADNYSWNKLFVRNLLIDNDLCFMPITLSEDQYISMIAPVVAGKVAVVDRPLINYRIGTGISLCDSKTDHPEGAYEGTYEVVKRFRELGVWEDVKLSYLNVAIRLMREYFDSMTELSKVKFLYDKYRNDIFPMLGATDIQDGYFHDPRVEDWYRMIVSRSLEEILFDVARAGGGTMTTAPLRFQVPYAEIQKHSSIVLVGKGLVGRYWYSQLLLSGYCEVVCWIDSEDNIPRDLKFDSIVVAK